MIFRELIGKPEEKKIAAAKREKLVKLLKSITNNAASLEEHLNLIDTIRQAKTWRLVDDDDEFCGADCLMSMIASEALSVNNTEVKDTDFILELGQKLDEYVRRSAKTRQIIPMSSVAQQMRRLSERMTAQLSTLQTKR